jgi:mannosyltransferase
MTEARERPIAAALFGLTLVALLLRFWGLTRQSLWADEALTIVYAGIFGRYTADKFFLDLQGPVHAAALHLWTCLFGTGEAALRSFGAILGTATIPCFYWALRPVLRREAALLACLLLAVSPFHLWYSQEVRNYVLLILMAVVSIGAYLRILQGRKGWVLYTVANVLGLLSNLSHAFLLGAQALGLIGFGRRRQALLARLALSWTATVLVLTPWFVQFYHRMVVPSGLTGHPATRDLTLVRGATTVPIFGLPYAYYAFATGYSYGPSLAELHETAGAGLAASVRGQLPALLWAVAALGVVGILGARKLWREGGPQRFWLLLLILPVALTYLVALLNVKIFNVRYAAVAFPALLVVLTMGVFAPARAWVRWSLLTAILIPFGVSIAGYEFDSRYWKEDARSAAAFIRAETRPGDLLLTVGSDLPLSVYYWPAGGGVPPGLERWNIVTWQEEGLPIEEQFDRFEELARSHRRVFVLFLRPKDTDREGRWTEYLSRRGGVERTATYPGVTIRVVVGGTP